MTAKGLPGRLASGESALPGPPWWRKFSGWGERRPATGGPYRGDRSTDAWPSAMVDVKQRPRYLKAPARRWRAGREGSPYADQYVLHDVRLEGVAPAGRNISTLRLNESTPLACVASRSAS